MNNKAATLLRAALTLGLALLLGSIVLGTNTVQEKQKSTFSVTDKAVITAFEERVKEYIKLRERIKERLPKLSKDSTPEQIEAHKRAFEQALRAARGNAKRGDIFTPAVADYIRRTIKAEFQGKDRKELRKTILEAETQGVLMRVNYPYPEAKELTEMPPTVLLNLPQLPKEVKYRFVGQNMLLVDRETGLILDYMLDALP